MFSCQVLSCWQHTLLCQACSHSSNNNGHPLHALFRAQNQPLELKLMIRKVFLTVFLNIPVTQGLFLGLQNFNSCKIIQNELVCETSHWVCQNDFLTFFLSIKDSCACHKTYMSRFLFYFDLV